MARLLSRGAFHEILCRNLKYLLLECPHSALSECCSVEELVPSALANRRAAIFNSVLVSALLDSLESVRTEDVTFALMRILHLCCAIGDGRLNTFMAVPAYQQLAASVDAPTLLSAVRRVLTAALTELQAFSATDVIGELNMRHLSTIKVIAGVCTLLHGFLVCNQVTEAVCEAVASAEEESGYALLCTLLELQNLGTQAPECKMPLRKLVLCIRSLTNIALLSKIASLLMTSEQTKSTDSSPSRRASRGTSPSLRTNSAFSTDGSPRRLERPESFSHPRTPSNRLNTTTRLRTPAAASAGRRRAWSVEANRKFFPAPSQHVGQFPASAMPVKLKRDADCIRNSKLMFTQLLQKHLWENWIADALGLLLAAAPNLKSYAGKLRLFDELEVLSMFDVYDGIAECTALNPTAPSLDSVQAYSKSRYRDITAKAVTDTLVVLLKCSAAGHYLQREYIATILYDDNASLLILKYLAQDLKEYLGVPDLPSDTPCEHNIDEAYTDAQALAECVRYQGQHTSRRRSSTSVMAVGVSPVLAPLTPAPQSFVAACGQHGIIDASLSLASQQAASGSDVPPAPPALPLPPPAMLHAPRGILTRTVSAPAESPSCHHARFSIAEDISAELSQSMSPHEKRNSPTQTSRPSLDLGAVNADSSSGPATDEPVKRKLLSDEFHGSVTTSVGIIDTAVDVNIARIGRISGTTSPVGDLASTAVPSFDPTHVIAAAAGITLPHLRQLDDKRVEMEEEWGTRTTLFPIHAERPGGFVDPASGQALSRRRIAILVNLLRILVAINKSVPERINDQLVKHKSHIPLVKAISLDIPPILYYSLKLVKLQIRHLGIWKRKNMSIISSIYRFVPLSLGGDPWLVTPGLQEAVAATRSQTLSALDQLPSMRFRSSSASAAVTRSVVVSVAKSASTAVEEAQRSETARFSSAADLRQKLTNFLGGLKAPSSDSSESSDTAGTAQLFPLEDLTPATLRDWVRLMI